MAEEEVKYQVPAVVGAISVLKELSGLADQGATQSDLVASTGVSKSTMHNLLSTLEAHDFVRREPHTRMYRLGPALIPLGVEATRQVKL
ncbi:MAG: helix-turn-helix domain-containing protein, partial [Solirubrobacterales bacterium]